MNTVPLSNAQPLQTDSLAKGIGVLAIANIIQRAIGFIRNLAFCYFLHQSDIGLWALASSFLVLAPPLSVLGIPGCFGRYVESFRRVEQLRSFLRRSLAIAAVGVMVLTTSLLVFPTHSSLLVFGTTVPYSAMIILTCSLLSVVAFNTLLELLNGLRQPSAVSAMQLTSSISFSLLCIPVLIIRPQWQYLVATYAISMTIGLLPGLVRLSRRCGPALSDAVALSKGSMLFRITPFAIAVWSSDLLTNLFDVVDRYMILYLATDDVLANQILVGQFHTARILPVLFLSLAMMLAGMILPYWTSEWEVGNKQKVFRMLFTTIKLSLFSFWGGSVVILLLTPILFETFLDGRYAISQQALPFAMTHCIIAAAAMMLGVFLRCIEANRWAVGVLAVGLLVNVLANWVAVPYLGVIGAMIATLSSTALIVGMYLLLLHFKFAIADRGTVIMLFLPLTLLLGPVAAVASFVASVFILGRTNWIIDRTDRQEIDDTILPLAKRLGLRLASVWPTPIVDRKLGVSRG